MCVFTDEWEELAAEISLLKSLKVMKNTKNHRKKTLITLRKRCSKAMKTFSLKKNEKLND